MSYIDQNISELENKMVTIARGAIGETMMGPGYYLNDGNGVHSEPNWCEAAAETIAAMATGERIRFPSAEAHYQALLAQGKIIVDDNPPPGTFVFYHWEGDVFGHITVSSGNGNSIGTVIVPAQIEELPIHHYSGFSGYAHAEAVIEVAKTMAPADPTGGGLGIVDPTKTYRVFTWIKDEKGNAMVLGHALRDFWEKNGAIAGITRYGYPMSQEQDEVNDKGISLTMQWFERTRLEFHPENQDPYRVEMGRLGAELMDYWQDNGQDMNTIKIIPSTDLLDSRFIDYFNNNGGIETLGLPLSKVASVPDSTFQTQILERAMLEIHPESTDWPTQARRIGAEIYGMRQSGKNVRISG